MDGGTSPRLQNHPAFCLAMGAVQMAPGETVIWVDVDGKSLSSVEQLD